MAKKKKVLTKEQKLIEKAKKLLTQNRREFVIGLTGLIIIFGLIAYGTVITLQKPKLSIPENKPIKQSEPEKSSSTDKFYILKEGESLSDVANKEYGNPNLYPTLVILNNLGSPDTIEPGMKIKIK